MKIRTADVAECEDPKEARQACPAYSCLGLCESHFQLGGIHADSPVLANHRQACVSALVTVCSASSHKQNGIRQCLRSFHRSRTRQQPVFSRRHHEQCTSAIRCTASAFSIDSQADMQIAQLAIMPVSAFVIVCFPSLICAVCAVIRLQSSERLADSQVKVPAKILMPTLCFAWGTAQACMACSTRYVQLSFFAIYGTAAITDKAASAPSPLRVSSLVSLKRAVYLCLAY